MDSDRHFNDEVLLADSLGELDKTEHRRVVDHIARCWRCRTTANRLRQEFEEIAAAVDQDTFPSPERVARAKAAQLAEAASEPRKWRAWLRVPLMRWAAATVVAAAVAVASVVWHEQRSSLPSPVVAIDRTAIAAPPERVPPPRTEPAKPTPQPAPSAPMPREMRSMEVRIRYALHQAGACRREFIDIKEVSDGLAVTAAVSSAEAKSRILAALSGVPLPAWVKAEILTGEEAARRKRTAAPRLVEAEPAAMVREPRLAVQDELQAHFGQRPGDVMAFTNRAVALAEEALVEAWALRRLAERFSGREDLDGASAALLERMVEEHAAALRGTNRQAREWIGPVVEAVAARRELTRPGEAPGADLFNEVQRMHASVIALFAVDLVATPPRENVHRDLLFLLGSFERIEAAVHRTGAIVAGAPRQR